MKHTPPLQYKDIRSQLRDENDMDPKVFEDQKHFPRGRWKKIDKSNIFLILPT